MKTDMDRSKGNGWEGTGNFVRQQGAEEVITRRSDSEAQRRRTERTRAAAKARQDRDRKILIIGGVSILLVIILIFSAGRSWQRRVDKKEINRLNQSNADLQTQIQDLQKSNADLQSTIASLKTKTEDSATTKTVASGTKHELQTAYNFRAEASVDSEVLAELDEGTTVTIVKVLDDGWVQVKYDNQTGYLKCGDELSETAANTTSGDTSPADSTEDTSAAEEYEEA